MLRLCSNRFPPKVSEIRTNDTVSILNVLHSDGAIGDKFFTYHPLEFFVSRVTYHPLEPSSFLCFGNIMLGVTFKIVLDSSHQHALEVAAIFGSIVVVQPFFTWLEFHNPILGMYFEDAITIPAIVGHSVLGLLGYKLFAIPYWL